MRAGAAVTFSLLLLALGATTAHATFPGRNGAIASTVGGRVVVEDLHGRTTRTFPLCPGCVGHPGWRADGHALSWAVSEMQQLLRVYTGYPSRAGAPQITQGWNTRRLHPEGRVAWAPDNQQIAAENGDGRISVVDVRDLIGEQYSFRGSRPAWSADDRLAFVRGGALWAPAPSGDSTIRLLRGPVDDPDWSPDSRRIAFARARHIWILDTRTRKLRRLRTPPASHPVWSPDGRSILYVLRGSGRGGLHTLEIRRLSGPDRIKHLRAGPDPAWQALPRARCAAGEASGDPLARDGAAVIYRDGDEILGCANAASTPRLLATEQNGFEPVHVASVTAFTAPWAVLFIISGRYTERDTLLLVNLRSDYQRELPFGPSVNPILAPIGAVAYRWPGRRPFTTAVRIGLYSSGVPVLGNVDGRAGEEVVQAANTGTTSGWAVVHAAPAGTPSLRFVTSAAPGYVDVADVNGDGRADLLGSDGTGLDVALGRGDGTFEPVIRSGVGGTFIPTPGRFDGDSVLDVADGTVGGPMRILHGLGDGRFTTATTPTGVNGVPTAPTDFDGDGHLDLMLVRQDGVTIALGRGDGTFRTAATLPEPFALTGHVVAVADVDGDGRPDVLELGDCPVEGVCLAHNEGGGRFSPATDVSAGPGVADATDLAAGDVTGDGRVDLVLAYRGDPSVAGGRPATVRVLGGNGDGTFTAGPPLTAGRSLLRVAIGDVTGDGAPDIVVEDSYQGCDPDLNRNRCRPGELITVLPNHPGGFAPVQPFDDLRLLDGAGGRLLGSGVITGVAFSGRQLRWTQDGVPHTAPVTPLRAP